jgi:two-component system sensor histidine kinase TctE
MAVRHDTLRTRLLHAVLLPALVVVAISGLFDYLSAVALAQHTQDSLLLKTATALATRMSPDEDHETTEKLRQHLSPADVALLRADPVDDIHFVVLDGNGDLLAGDASLCEFVPSPVLAPGLAPHYEHGVHNGQAVRTIRLTHRARGVDLQVLVTETNRKRLAATRQILLNTLWPNLLLLVVMLGLMRQGIRQALAPLQDLSQHIDQREVQDLQPIPEDQVLGEIRPLVTAINGMLARLQKATAEQQVFLSGAAHQLRTPLAGIQTQLELASHQATPEIRARLDRLHSAVRELSHCTQQMLTLARSSTHASTAHDLVEVDLPGLVEDAASNWLDMAVQRHIDLGFELAAARTTGSAWMLQEMLGNLIDNAIKHSPGAGTITVRCGCDAGQHPFLEVEDNGPGIAQSEQDRVFEAFYRSPQTGAEGSGLGLAIVREVASRHGARVAFVQPPGAQGTCIRITFPPRPALAA